MKRAKNILSVVNLTVFVSWFALFLVVNFAYSNSNQTSNQINKLSVSTHHILLDFDSQQVSEETETETETEGTFELSCLILPFIFNFFQFEIFQTFQPFSQTLAEKTTNQIYISVCNFRI